MIQRMLAILAAAVLLLPAPAQADLLSRSAYDSALATNLPDNAAGAISEQDIRDAYTDLADSVPWRGEVEHRVTNMSTTTPPASPSDGDTYVVGASATGAWSGQDGSIAIWDAAAAAWAFYAPGDGLPVYNLADSTAYRYSTSGGAWAAISSASDADAIHDNVSGEIAALTEKASPGSTDLIIIEDSAASNAKKKVQIGNLPSGGGSSLTGDIYYPYVSALLHGDGADASTTFTDDGPHARTYTANGNAQIDTAQSKYGGASMLFDGTGDYLSSANNAVFLLGNGPFTVGAWVRFNSVASTQRFAGVWNGGAAQRSWLWRWNTTNQLQFIYSTDGSASTTVSWPWTPSTGTWYHVAVVRHRNTLRAFVDGTEIGSATAASATFFASTAAFEVGGVEATEYVNGWMDDLRLSKGVARYWQNFTAPTAAFGNGAAY